LEEEMKKVILVLTVAAVFAFTGTVMASPTVCPPFEGFYIYTETDVDVSGNMSEEEDFEWTWNNNKCVKDEEGNLIPQDLNDDELAVAESVARLGYEENFDSYNGLDSTATTYHKDFTADTHPDGDYNLEVNKDIGFTSDGVAGHHADFKEVVSEEIVSAGGAFLTGDMFEGVLALCPWAPTPTKGEWPATNEGIAMGSMFAIPYNLQAGEGPNGEIDFHSMTEAAATKSVYLNYDVQASGKGKVQAEMIARLWEGSNVMNAVTPGDTWLNSTATYEEKTVADGIINSFHKGMTYKAQFELPGVNPIGLDILQ
jgi:hypothetical protein